MAKLVAINNQKHRNLIIDTSKAEQYGAELNLIPTVLSEFVSLAVQYPIVFTKNGETGEFVCAAMLGFESSENLFWQNGQWQGMYLPLQIQRQPFFIGESSEQGNENIGENKDYIVCIDVESPMISEAELIKTDSCNKLYSDDGKESDYLIQAKNTLANLLQGEADTKAFITTLKAMDLLQPLSLEIAFVNEQTTRLNGLYTINQDKLAALSCDKITSLHQSGLLQPIYTMIASLAQIYALIERKNQRIQSYT
jgi:hypothetical protein